MKHVPSTLSEKNGVIVLLQSERNEVYISHVAEKDEYFFSVFEQTKKDETAWFTSSHGTRFMDRKSTIQFVNGSNIKERRK